MVCPRCNAVMNEIEKHGISVDMCRECGGMWLDKGELAKIVNDMRDAEQSSADELGVAHRAPVYQREYDNHHGGDGHESRYHEEHRYGQDHRGDHRKKTGLQRLFDIFD
jgi:uncharacterized protein